MVQQPYVGEALLSIARCDGVYPPNPAHCVSTVSATAALQWSTEPEGSGCRLEPGGFYWFNSNMGTQTAPGGGQPWCASWMSGPICEYLLSTTVQPAP